MLFKFLRSDYCLKDDYLKAAWIVGIIIMIIGFIAAINMKETFGKDLDFVEE
jgi:hypothetical protein